MKLVYVTAKTYPASTADHFFVEKMADAFARLLPGAFTLVVAEAAENALAGIPHENVHLRVRRGVRLQYFFKLPGLIRTYGAGKDTVYFANDPNLLVLLMFWRRVLGASFRIASDWHMLFGDWRDRAVAEGSDCLVATTRHLKNQLVAATGVDAGRVVVAYGGVDLAPYSASKNTTALRQELGLPEGFLVGYVGLYKTLGMSKGLEVMIKALRHSDDRTMKMVFVGGRAGEIEEYRAYAEKEGVEDRCIFVPLVPTEHVPAYEQAVDALAIPYPDQPHFRDYGFPMKAYEYMASGKPIIYSDLPVMREVLQDCATAFVPDDARALAHAIERVRKERAHAEALAHAARSKAEASTWDARAKTILAALAAL
ncbi:MAG TPA: glycosyltransferase [Candidatus Paceibacterota bacterium]|nr:glycosyltransferase [Candidatus Paceibacterota bacterium]